MTARSTAARPDAIHTYTEDGTYRATLTVTDQGGRRASADVDIVVGNEAPVVEFVIPVAGQAFSFGDTVTYEVRVTDDQPVDCSKVTVTYVLGHDTHGHPQSTANGCTGSHHHHGARRATTRRPTTSRPSSSPSTPTPAPSPRLTGSDEVVLEPAG